MIAVCAEEYVITVGSTSYNADLRQDRQFALNGSQREITGPGDFAHIHLALCIHKQRPQDFCANSRKQQI